MVCGDWADDFGLHLDAEEWWIFDCVHLGIAHVFVEHDLGIGDVHHYGSGSGGEGLNMNIEINKEELVDAILAELDLSDLAGELELRSVAEHIDMDELGDIVAEKLKAEESGEDVDQLETRVDSLEGTVESIVRENDKAHQQTRAIVYEYRSELSHRCEELEEEVRHLKEQLAKLGPLVKLVDKLKKLERLLG